MSEDLAQDHPQLHFNFKKYNDRILSSCVKHLGKRKSDCRSQPISRVSPAFRSQSILKPKSEEIIKINFKFDDKNTNLDEKMFETILRCLLVSFQGKPDDIPDIFPPDQIENTKNSRKKN